MARYIDLDKAIERIEGSPAFPNMGMDGYFLRDVVCDLLKKQPAADVVPKSEVARKICCEIEEEIVAALESNYKARTRYYTKQKYEKVDEEFINTVNGKIAALRGIEGFIAELKKKYTEEME